MTAETLTFVTPDSIPSEIDNSNNTASSVGADPQGSASQAEANAKAASDPKGSADAALTAAQAHADAQANLATVTSKAYADGIVDEEEARAIADAQAKADQAEANAEAARIAWSDESVYVEQDPVQISGGGYIEDNNRGWGITSGGSATFNGNLRVVNGVIEGGTIIGVDIYGGSQLYLCDQNTDGTADDYRYYDSPTIPLACISQPRASQKQTFSGLGRRSHIWASPIASAMDRQGSVNTDRCRWGIIAQDTFRLDMSNPDGGGALTLDDTTYITFEIISRKTGAVTKSVSVSRATTYSTWNQTIYLGSLALQIYMDSPSSVNTFYIRNLRSVFGSTSDDTLNGTLRITLNMKIQGNWSTPTATLVTNVNNEVMP